MTVHRAITPELRSQVLRDADAIVAVEYADDLLLDDVARRIATSRRQLQRVYLEMAGTTFRTRLTAVRMERGAELLAGGPVTVREVADRVGYRQPAQFAKAFRRHFGCSPTEYRDGRVPAGST